MIEKLLKRHAVFNHAEDLSLICRPLNLLGINYFAKANVDSLGQFSFLCNSPQFADHYLNGHYFNADIHRTPKELGNHIFWDFVKIGGKSLKMHTEAAQFGIQHTFTMIQNNKDGSKDYFHFASQKDHSINQIYLTHLDLLKMFILHFNDKIGETSQLAQAYQMKIITHENAAHFELNLDDQPLHLDIKSEFIKKLDRRNKPTINRLFAFDAALHQLTSREQECLYHYIHGKSPREISQILFLSKRTIEQYMETIKIKLNVRNKAELIEKTLSRLTMNFGCL